MVQVLILEWLPDGQLDCLKKEFTSCEFVEARRPELVEQCLPGAALTYGLPSLKLLNGARELRWVQLISAGVPQDLCPLAKKQNLLVTNLAGLYGPTIAEHALGMMLILSRNLQVVLGQQREKKWERNVARTMRDLHGKTLAVVGLGNIGRHIARLGQAMGMRVVGCRRTYQWTPFVDRVFPLGEIQTMLSEADYVAVAAPLTRETEGMLGPAEFQAMKPGTIYINVSRGSIAQEKALLDGLRNGRLAGAGLDVFAVEPLPAEHPFWSMPQVLVSPHYSGETVNQTSLPAQRFARNLRSWLAGQALEGVVKLDLGY